MLKKIFSHALIFLLVFVIISLIADIYYYNRVIQKDPNGKGQISFSDFRVFRFASYNIRHHVMRVPKTEGGSYTFEHFWFLNSESRKTACPSNLLGGRKYPVYNKSEKFYHYRYSPFMAFAIIPFGIPFHQGHSLAAWYILLNVAFISSIWLLAYKVTGAFSLSRNKRYFIMWGVLLFSLRFYLTNISLGQSDILIAFFFTLFLVAYVGGKDIFCGILLALILQFKLLFLPLLVYFVLIGKKKLVISAVISFISLLFIPAYMLGFEKNLSLLRDWFEILSMSIPSQILNTKNESIAYAIGSFISKFGFVKSAFRPEHVIYFLSATLTLLFYTSLLWIRRFVKKFNWKEFKYVEVSLLILTAMIFSPIAWGSHFINSVVPLSVALAVGIKINERRQFYTALGIFFLLSCMIGTDLTGFIPQLENSVFPNISIGMLSLGYALIYAYARLTNTNT